jgi:hypothetical protein
MSLALPFALASQHLPELAQIWGFITHPSSDPVVRPVECGPYVEQLEHTVKLIASCSFFIIAGISLASVFALAFVLFNLKNEERKFFKRLAEATPEEREEELMRICRGAHITLERRENGRSEKMDDYQEV